MTDQRDILDRLQQLKITRSLDHETHSCLSAAISEITAHRAEIERLKGEVKTLSRDLELALDDVREAALKEADPPKPERWEPGYVTGATAELARKEAIRINPVGSQPFGAYCDQNGAHYLWFRRRVTP